MPNVAAFNSIRQSVYGRVIWGWYWNGSAFVARQAGGRLAEGGIFWMDSTAIPANAKNKGALKLIFLLRPDV